MVLAAPELVEAERVDLLDEIEVAAELQQRILSGFLFFCSGPKLRGEPEQGNPCAPRPAHGCRAESTDLPSPGIPHWGGMDVTGRLPAKARQERSLTSGVIA